MTVWHENVTLWVEIFVLQDECDETNDTSMSNLEKDKSYESF